MPARSSIAARRAMTFSTPCSASEKLDHGPHDLARDRRIIGRLAGLLLVGVDHDQIDQMPRHPHVMRAQATPSPSPATTCAITSPPWLRDADRLLQPAQIGALVLIGQVAVLVRRGGAQDADVGDDVGEMQPGLARRTRPATRWAPPRPWRSSRSLRGPGRRRSPARPWSARPAAAPRPRGACRTGCPRARCRPRPGPRRSSSRSRASAGWTSPTGRTPPCTRARSPSCAMWSMPLTPYMSPAAIGCSVVRPRGWPSDRNRSPMAASTRSGQPSAEDDDTVTTAPSAIRAAAACDDTTLLISASLPRGPSRGFARGPFFGSFQIDYWNDP